MTPKQIPCSGCGQLIFFARTVKGARMPMDASSVVYDLVEATDGGPPVIQVRPGAYVSHFRTCKMAKEFSNRGKKPAPTTEGPCPPSTSASTS